MVIFFPFNVFLDQTSLTSSSQRPSEYATLIVGSTMTTTAFRLRMNHILFSSSSALQTAYMRPFCSTTSLKAALSTARSKTETPATPLQPEPAWKIHQRTMKRKYPEGFNPPSRLSREAMDVVRRLHASDPEKFTTPALAKQFKISAEGIRRILKSKWRPSAAKVERERARGRPSEVPKGPLNKLETNEETDETEHLVQQWRAKQEA